MKSVTLSITHIRMSSGSGHEHIVAVKWHKTSSKTEEGEIDTKTMVDWIENKNVSVFASNGKSLVPVKVMDHKYLRTKANDTWTDNLLSLPRF